MMRIKSNLLEIKVSGALQGLSLIEKSLTVSLQLVKLFSLYLGWESNPHDLAIIPIYRDASINSFIFFFDFQDLRIFSLFIASVLVLNDSL